MQKSVERLLEFIESKGGIPTVASKIGVSGVLFYNYKNRGSLPNMGVLESLAKSYDDFDPDYILRGKSTIKDLYDKIETYERERQKLLSLFLEQKTNFKLGDTSNLLADNLEPIKKTDEITRSLLLGVSFWNEVGEA